MTTEQLAQFDGKEGRKAYVAYKGAVYDVTESRMWKEGSHMKRHHAGSDLTQALEGAPHGEEVFSRMPKVDTLEVSVPKSAKEALRRWYQRYHPHPMTVHFPIALHLFAGAMDLLFFFWPTERIEASVFYSFAAATVMGLPALGAGVFSWWINYDLAWKRPFAVKLIGALVTIIVGFAGIIFYLENPGIAWDMASGTGIAYHGFVLGTVPVIVTVAYFGGKLTWPES